MHFGDSDRSSALFTTPDPNPTDLGVPPDTDSGESIRFACHPFALLSGQALSAAKDLACEREDTHIRWPDPSASPQDDRGRVALGFFRIRMSGRTRAMRTSICCPGYRAVGIEGRGWLKCQPSFSRTRPSEGNARNRPFESSQKAVRPPGCPGPRGTGVTQGLTAVCPSWLWANPSTAGRGAGPGRIAPAIAAAPPGT